jgi:hypothetical protein
LNLVAFRPLSCKLTTVSSSKPSSSSCGRRYRSVVQSGHTVVDDEEEDHTDPPRHSKRDKDSWNGQERKRTCTLKECVVLLPS